uniref:tetratricopeptide repeat protein n=1 Tax=Flavobacterium sp. TaxID=239 RepID=UPI00404A8241
MLNFLSSWGQKKNNEKFITWEQFIQNFGKEIVSAQDVFNNMQKSGLSDFSLAKFDFHFVSNTKDKLEKLQEFLKEHYPYEIKSIKKINKGLWELHGETNEIPITQDNLPYWGLDMYKRGYEFDTKLDGYGAPFDPKNQKFPDFDVTKEDFYYNKGLECYNSGDLSGAIFNWTICIKINPKNPDSYYSRAIVKNELYTWKSALLDYNKAIEIAPDFISAIVNRGSVKDENGDYKGAIEDYDKVINLKNVDIENKQMAYFNKGNSEFNLGNKTKACESWKKAHELGAEYALERISEKCK